jgi:hypothetical protein
VLSALAASRQLSHVVDDIQRSLVRQARQAGHSWAVIGEMLGVTRQAAFQRFGGAAAVSARAPDGEALLPGAAEAGLRVLDHFVSQRWDEMRSGFDERMTEAAQASALREIWQRSDRRLGAFRSMGTPSVRALSGYTVVDVPVTHERGGLVRRVVFNAEGQVSGFFVLPAEPGGKTGEE